MPDKVRNHHTINKTLLYYSIQKLKKNQLFKEIERESVKHINIFWRFAGGIKIVLLQTNKNELGPINPDTKHGNYFFLSNHHDMTHFFFFSSSNNIHPNCHPPGCHWVGWDLLVNAEVQF